MAIFKSGSKRQNVKYFMAVFLSAYISIMFSGCAAIQKKNPWTVSDHTLYTTALALHGADWMQTKAGIGKYGMSESNVILGEEPEQNNIDTYFASTALGISALTWSLSKGWRKTILIGWNIVEFFAVMQNNSLGVKISFE